MRKTLRYPRVGIRISQSTRNELNHYPMTNNTYCPQRPIANTMIFHSPPY